MAGKNKYSCRSKISAAKVRQIVKLFAIDLTATQVAQVTGLNRNTVNRYLAAFRERIAQFCEAETPIKGVVEVDESYFGARRVRGIRGRGARGKTIVGSSTFAVEFTTFQGNFPLVVCAGDYPNNSLKL